jgi:hypothetical protein
MRSKNVFLVAALFLFCGCASTKPQRTVTTLLPPHLQPQGRFYFDGGNSLHLVSSAVHFGVSFSGNECRIYASLTDTGAHNYLQYVLDGTYGKRIRLNGNNKSPIIINASAGNKHTLWIYKATEAQTGDIVIDSVNAENLAALKNPELPMIEFIGNSITCAAAADASEYPCGTGAYHDQHNAYMAYGPRVARELNVNYIVSGVSGIGIYRTWNRDGPSMPQVYEKTDFQPGSNMLWDFRTYSPVIVSIALGTNDVSKGDGKVNRSPFDSATYVNGYISFIKTVKSKYPSAQIALLSSPTVHGQTRELLERCITAVGKATNEAFPGAKPVAVFFFDEMNVKGCSGHPNVEEHAVMARQLLPFFKNLLGR